jgi:anti-sigma regulatory factor (Ser/Thr protein kinase)
MRDISLHLLDIAENSVNAGATKVRIKIKEDLKEDKFILMIVDDGKGFDMKKKDSDPFFTKKKGKKFGLGIPFLKQAVRECEGRLSIESAEGGGTKLTAEFRRSHIDMKPLGDMGSTISTLVGSYPEMEYAFVYEFDGDSYSMDTGMLKDELEGLPLNNPTVLRFIKDDINDGIRRIRG